MSWARFVRCPLRRRFTRTISRTWRMQTLPAGFNPLPGKSQKADPKHSQRNAPSPLQCRATISRNRWARISRNQWARIFRNRRAPSSRNRWAVSLGISIPCRLPGGRLQHHHGSSLLQSWSLQKSRGGSQIGFALIGPRAATARSCINVHTSHNGSSAGQIGCHGCGMGRDGMVSRGQIIDTAPHDLPASQLCHEDAVT